MWQSIHVSVRMTNAAYATDLARYMSADAKTSHRENVTAMGTLWTHWGYAVAPARMM